jgi:SAM-dependent methyltransferase
MGLEAQLLLYCSRSLPEADATRRVEHLLEGEIDWTLLTRLALANRVTPLLHSTLARIETPGIPPEFLEALQSHCRVNDARGRQLTEELLQILAALDSAGVPVLPFKGVTLAHRAYGDVALRWAGDIDLLIRKEHLDAIHETLAARGYLEVTEVEERRRLGASEQVWTLDQDCEYLYVRREDDMCVEPHWALAPRRLAIALDYDGIWKRAAPLTLDGRTFPGFAIEDLILALGVHGSKHQWVELRWCCDLAELARRDPDIDWDACLARAAQAGCRRMLAIGLLLAVDLLEAPVPAHVVRSMREDRTARDLAVLAALRMFDIDSERQPPLSGLSAFRFRMRERWRDRIAYVLRSTTTPTLDQVRRLPLPGSLRFLHYAIRPLVDLVDPLRRPPRNGLDTDAPRSPAIDGKAWSRRSETWKRWADHNAETSGWLSERLVDRAQLNPRGTVLDLASGVGEPALHAARHVKDGGVVIGIDASPEMLAVARARGRDAGLDNLQLCVAAMEELPFPADTFDAVVCRFGITCSSRVESILAEVRRVLRRAKPVAFLVWGPREDSSLLEFAEEAVASFFGDGYVTPDPDAFRFAEPGSLADALGRAGFAEVEEDEVRRTEPVPDTPACWRAHYETTYGDLVGDLPRSVRNALEERIAARFEELRRRPRASWTTHARIGVGWKP